MAIDEHISTDVPKMTPVKTVSIVLLIVVLLSLPITVIVMGRKTRQNIKANEDCVSPKIPDPSECIGGEWKLYKNEQQCVRFRCVPQ